MLNAGGFVGRVVEGIFGLLIAIVDIDAVNQVGEVHVL